MRYVCAKTHNVYRNKKCWVFHICLFNERYDFCDFDNGYRNVSIILSCTEQARVYWIIKRKPKIHVLILGVFHVISNLALGVGQSFLCSRQGVGHVFFLSTTFPNAQAHHNPTQHQDVMPVLKELRLYSVV